MLGVMAAHTANAGWIYFPAGVPDFSDVDGSHIDFGKNLAREMNEETGLAASEYKAEQGWTTVLAGARIAQIKILAFGGDGFLVARTNPRSYAAAGAAGAHRRAGRSQPRRSRPDDAALCHRLSQVCLGAGAKCRP